MNGRVYDYNLGRFMGVDPFIVGSENTQSINPYSYVLNNPLAFTDPSGYSRVAAMREKQITNHNKIIKEFNAALKKQTPDNGGEGGKAIEIRGSAASTDTTAIGSNEQLSKNENTSTNENGEANFKINRLNDQIDAVEATKAKESEYSITLVAHQEESINVRGKEIPDLIGHAFIIMRGPNGEFAKGFWPVEASDIDFLLDTAIAGTMSNEEDYHSYFKAWQTTGKDPKGGQFAFRSFALTKAQYNNGLNAISNWDSNTYMGRSRMCGTFAKHVLESTGQSFGNSQTPYYLFSEMGGSFDKN